METIFDYNPTEAETRRICGGCSSREELIKSFGGNDPYLKYNDERLWALGFLFMMRDDVERACSYFVQMKDKERAKYLFMGDVITK